MPTRHSAAETARDQELLEAIPTRLGPEAAKEAVENIKRQRAQELAGETTVPDYVPTGCKRARIKRGGKDFHLSLIHI